MEQRKWKMMEAIIGVFSLSFVILMFVHWYNTGSTPLGWDTPLYILKMLELKEKGLLHFLAYSHYEYITYPLLGGLISNIFNISPYYVEIYLPIILSLVLVLTWYNLSKRWFKDRVLNILTLFFSITCYSTFDLPIFRHSNLLGFIIALVGLSFIPDLYTKTQKKKKLTFLWGIFFLGGLTHPHTLSLIWGILFLTTLLFLLPRNFREKIRLSCQVKQEYVKTLFMRILLLGTAVFIPLGIGLTIGEGTTLVAKKGLVQNAGHFFRGALRELFLDFGGFMILFFLAGFKIAVNRLYDPTRGFRFKESILLLWTITPTSIFLLSFFLPIFTVYAKRALLLLPLPLLEALGTKKIAKVLRTKIDKYSISSLNLEKEKLYGLSLLVTIIIPMMGTEYLIYQEVGPSPRFISQKSVNQLEWIGQQTNSLEKPIFVIYRGDWTDAWVGAWDDWIKCYIDSFYIYPGTINHLLQLQRPPTLKDLDRWYFNQMKKDSLLNYTKLKHHKIYLLPEFYKEGNFNTSEKAHLSRIPTKDLYLLNVTRQNQEIF